MVQAKDDRKKGHHELPTVQEHPDTQEGVLPTGSLFLSPDNKEWDKRIKNVHGWVRVKSQLDGPSGQCGGLNPSSARLSPQTTSSPHSSLTWGSTSREPKKGKVPLHRDALHSYSQDAKPLARWRWGRQDRGFLLPQPSPELR